MAMAASRTGRPNAHTTNIRTALRNRLAHHRVVGRFARFAGASVVATVISQLVLMGLYGLGRVDATLAGIGAFIAGAIPNFLINRHWAWGRRGKPRVFREMLPYLVVIATGGIASTALVTLADSLLQPVLTTRGWRTVALDGVYVASYALLFVIKFALLDRFVFNARRGRPEPAETT